MRRKLVAGNWKMHGSRQSVTELLNELKEGLSRKTGVVDAVVCPSTVHIPLASQLLENSSIGLGAQNVFHASEGAYTGETAPGMLIDYGVKYVIVGHSERRQLFGETNDIVAGKFVVIQKNGMIPILCLGETLEQRESGITEDVVLEQLGAVVDDAGIGAFATAVIAYEPVWAIGTGRTASPEQAQDVHYLIRDYLAGMDKNIASEISILYGGSVNKANAEKLFSQPDIDGGLVGGASLKAPEFISICKSLD